MTDLLREDEVGKKHRTAELYELCEGLQRIWTSNGKIRKREGLAYDDELGVEILVWVKTLRLWEEWESKGLGSMLLPMLHTMLRVHLGEGGFPNKRSLWSLSRATANSFTHPY